MAEVQPFCALRYHIPAVGSLEAVTAPPYDVVDEALRAELAARSPFNVVEIDLPRSEDGDPYEQARTTMETWRREGVLIREREPALWALTQDYTAADGRDYTRHGFLCRVRIEDYGPGRIRPHERTQSGPKEDRLRLLRATRANLSPIFSLFPDQEGAAWSALAPAMQGEPFAQVNTDEGTVNRLWRVTDRRAVAEAQQALEGRELLIADGHHRYETAHLYADEVGGEGGHRFVLMFVCSLSDPGLTVFATHRLLSGLDEGKRSALCRAIERDFHVEPVGAGELLPPGDSQTLAFGYLDAFHREPLRLVLKDRAIAEAALVGKSEPYRMLDTAVLEAILLRGALGMSEQDIAERRGLAYSHDFFEARQAVEGGHSQVALFLRPTPVEHVRAVAVTGEPMPPKSTFFYPKIPTGLVFNPLD